MSDTTRMHKPRLSATQQLLIQRLRNKKLQRASSVAVIPVIEKAQTIPLTSEQARIWFLVSMFPSSAEYNQAVTFRFLTCPEPQRILSAIMHLMQRHDALRLRLYEVAGEPVQELCGSLEAPFAWHDVSDQPPSLAECLAVEIGNQCLRKPFDLSSAPLFRVVLVRMPDAESVVIMVFHHLVVDGRSIEILSAEFVQLLRGTALPEPPGIRFVDYAAWRAAQRDSDIVNEQLGYWLERLRGELPVFDLPSDRPRTAMPSRRGHVVPCDFPADLVMRIRRLAEVEGTTTYVVLLAVYKVFLMRMTGQVDILVGAPFGGRENPQTENLVGMFVNTVILRTDLTGNPGFRSLLGRVHQTVLGAQDNRDVPFDRVVAELKLPRDINRNSLFQTMFAMGGLPASLSDDPAINDLSLDSKAAKWDLTVFLGEFDKVIKGHMEYAEDLFDELTALRFVDIYLRLCSTFASFPDTPIGKAPLISDEQRRSILEDLNPYQKPVSPYRTMSQPFEEQVKRTPYAVALQTEDGQLIYHDVNAAANRLAHLLRRRGVREGQLVGVCMERCADLVITLLAVAKSGAAYVPLDPELPEQRLLFMLADLDLTLLLAHAPTRLRLAEVTQEVLIVDCDTAQWAELPDSNPKCYAPPHRPVYLLYTSGSTGHPKAVVFPVNSALAEIFWLQRRYPLGEGDVNLFITSYGFDVSIWEIFWPLYFGGMLVIPRSGEHRDPRRLVELIQTHHVTTLFLTPAMLELVLEVLPERSCRSLRTLRCGGAPIRARLRDQFHEQLPSTLLVNCYGPTEAGNVTDMVLPHEASNPCVPLGRPAANYRFYVLDAEFQPCPIGVPGEAFLAGEVGIALGYHNRPALTAERFVPDPFGESGARMYRTGDLCRYRPDGVLEHLGRVDRQVKLRGIRVEPGEIEAVLCNHDAVSQCHVMLVDHPNLGPQLSAFVALRPGCKVEPQELMAHARKLLPPHMVPVSVVYIDSLPTNVNNKIDVAALSTRVWTLELEDVAGIVPPVGQDEEALLDIYRDLLGVDQIGVCHSFFDIGGHSLLVFKLIAKCEMILDWRPGVADIFRYPTVRELAKLFRSTERSMIRCLVPLSPQPAKPLVVFVPAASGSVLPFIEVARRLESQFSTWGLQAAELAEADSSISIAELAAGYVGEVDIIREMCPLILLGWSIGGCIAFEMARIWRARGVAVAALLLLDTWAPPMLLPYVDRERVLSIVQSLDLLGLEGIASADPAPGSDALDRMEAVRSRNVLAFAAYRPQIIDLDVDYLHARAPSPDASVELLEMMGGLPDRGWGSFSRSITMHKVDGDHFSMVGGEHAVSLATTLRDVINSRLGYEEI